MSNNKEQAIDLFGARLKGLTIYDLNCMLNT
jgi:hypothetical protein